MCWFACFGLGAFAVCVVCARPSRMFGHLCDSLMAGKPALLRVVVIYCCCVLFALFLFFLPCLEVDFLRFWLVY